MRLEIVYEPGDKVRVTRAPYGEENAWLKDKEGVVREVGAFIRVEVDGRACMLDPDEIAPLPEAVSGRILWAGEVA